ncbi:MAG: carboxylesterase family protein [Solirubrobacteraceae bacterium]
MSSQTVAIATTSGLLDVVRADGLVHARGVPYATAERFGAPEPVLTPDEPRDATRRGPACPQNPAGLESVLGPIASVLEQSEDCLVLSVVAPEDAEGLPVMVWLHGGAYVTGGGEAPKYDGDALAREGVVVVSVTSRIGVLGYLPPEGAGPDNLGLLDQLEALRWVASNIVAFGGDPLNVTAFGQSAGGDAVLALLATDDGPGLFRRGIVQSAPLGLREGRGPMTRAMRAVVGERLSGAVDPTTRDVLDAQLAAVQAAATFGNLSGLPFAPIAGLPPFSAEPGSFGRIAKDVDLLIGNAAQDASPFVALDPRGARLGRLGPIGHRIRAAIVRRLTEQIFGIDRVVARWREAGGTVATYRFSWAPRGSELGACHCIELPALFGDAWAGAPLLAGETVPDALAAAIRGAWVAFARDGVRGLPSQMLTFG